MDNIRWTHVAFQRGIELLHGYGVDLKLKYNEGSTFSAWVMALSDDGFRAQVRVAAIAIIESNGDDLRLHLGWMEYSAQTRGKRSRMVADLVRLAWGRWIDARRFYLVGGRGDKSYESHKSYGVALTRELSNQGVLIDQWARNRMRATKNVGASSAGNGSAVQASVKVRQEQRRMA